ncbi:MAG: hypothetical protein KDC00_00795, partial [Flavobacteriales bacterium]|nr:hypothetical protein [Flavobacteriales bacterium]
MLRQFRFALIASSLLVPSGTHAQDTKGQFVPALVGFYNIENLFDTLDTPGVNDEEFSSTGSKQWGTERYYRKLDQNAHVIAEMGKDLHP